MLKKINIIDHRAFWCKNISSFDDKKLQNTLQGFTNSFKENRGVETDIRDFNNELVISHDIPSEKNIKLTKVLALYKNLKCTGKLALNIKSDGLHDKLKKLLQNFNVSNYFVFDMSVPDSLWYANNDIKFYIRDSEHEVNPKTSSPFLYKLSSGVWLDKFNEETQINDSNIKDYLQDDKEICIVSPELHPWGRENNKYLQYWQIYKTIFDQIETQHLSRISICTDLPIQALEFFNN